MTDTSNIVAQLVTDDLYTFTLDNENKTLAKIEYTGEIVDGIVFNSDDGFNEFSLHETVDNNLLVYSVSANILYYINPFNLRVWKTETVPTTAGNNLVLDVYGNKVFGDWKSVAVDNDNNIYTVESTLLSSDYGTLGFDVSSESFLLDDITTYQQITGEGFYDMCFVRSLSTVTSLITAETPCASADNIYTTEWVREPIIFTNNNYEQVQFDVLYKNSGINGIISKPFNPQKVFVTKENYLYLVNDTREILELELNDGKPIRYSDQYTLFSSDSYTGNNIYDLDEPELAGRYDDFKQTPLWGGVSAEAISTVSINGTYEFNPTSEQFETYFWVVDSEEKALYKTDNEFTVIECFSLPDADRSSASNTPDEQYSLYTYTLPPATTYTWHRKYDWIASGKQDYGFSASVYTLNEDNEPVKHFLPFGDNTLADGQWYHVALTYDIDVGKLSLYLDNVLLSEQTIEANSPVYSFYETGGIVGGKLLRSNSINEELNCDMYSFDGAVYDIRMYDNTLTQSQLAQVIMSSLYIDPLEWNIPVGARQYIERIERFFMNRQPGHSSQFYKIRLVGLNISDTTLRAKIEQIINNTIEKVAPAYTTMYAIEWE